MALTGKRGEIKKILKIALFDCRIIRRIISVVQLLCVGLFLSYYYYYYSVCMISSSSSSSSSALVRLQRADTHQRIMKHEKGKKDENREGFPEGIPFTDPDAR